MAGIASVTAELYARHNIPTIPIGANKRPAVRGFKIASLTVDQTRAYMRRRPDADALGVPDGRLSGLVRVDIDEPGDDIVAKVIRRAGDTPAKVRTASGKTHLIYADNGERRLTGAPGKANARPWDDIRADLCGAGGYSISPPSRTNGGEYALLGDYTLEQLLENRHRLPKIQSLEPRAYLPRIAPVGADSITLDPTSIRVGERDQKFWPYIKRHAHQAKSFEELQDHAREINSMIPNPLSDAEMVAKCRYWWGKTERGENKWGVGQFTTVDHALIDHLMMRDLDAFTLLIFLRRRHWGRDFYLANETCNLMPGGGWPRKRFTGARSRLIEGGYLFVVKPATIRPQSPMVLRLVKNDHQ
jgi:Bifunctional DNA primase/polymerase, N-terminal